MSEIRTTLGHLVNAEAALVALGRLKPPAISAKTRYHIAKLTDLVSQAVALFTRHREEYGRELGEITNPGDPAAQQRWTMTPTCPQWPEYVKRLTDLAEQPEVIHWGPITDEMIADADVSVGEMRALGPLGPLAETQEPEAVT